ncbi:uncharacterized protein ACIBXB_016299 isoform 2-T2 [Morphnus guianensis]
MSGDSVMTEEYFTQAGRWYSISSYWGLAGEPAILWILWSALLLLRHLRQSAQRLCLKQLTALPHNCSLRKHPVYMPLYMGVLSSSSSSRQS